MGADRDELGRNCAVGKRDVSHWNSTRSSSHGLVVVNRYLDCVAWTDEAAAPVVIAYLTGKDASHACTVGGARSRPAAHFLFRRRTNLRRAPALAQLTILGRRTTYRKSYSAAARSG